MELRFDRAGTGACGGVTREGAYDEVAIDGAYAYGEDVADVPYPMVVEAVEEAYEFVDTCDGPVE